MGPKRIKGKGTFVLDKPKSKEETLIFYIFRWGSKNRVPVSTKIFINPKYWVPRPTYRVKNVLAVPNSTEINDYLTDVDKRAKELFRNFVEEFLRYPTEKEFKAVLRKKLHPEDFNNIKHSLLTYAKDVFIPMKRGNVSDGRVKRIAKDMKDLASFAEEESFVVDFNSMGIEFSVAYVEWLNSRGLKETTIFGKMKLIKSVLHAAYKMGHIDNKEFMLSEWLPLDGTTYSIALTEEQIELIYKFEPSKKHLIVTRDLFCFLCWSGFRYTNMASLQKHNFKNLGIQKLASKSNKEVIVPYFWKTREIAERYDHDFESISISSFRFNENLKKLLREIGEFEYEVVWETKSGVQRKKAIDMIKSHTGRRSLATNLYLRGCDKWEIMDYTGHKKTDSLDSYIKTSPEQGLMRSMVLRERGGKPDYPPIT